MLFRNISKEVIQPFSIGNDDKVVGTYMAMDTGQPVKRQRTALVEVFTPAVKPNDIVEIPAGLASCMGGIKPRGSYLKSIGLEGKLVPVEAKSL